MRSFAFVLVSALMVAACSSDPDAQGAPGADAGSVDPGTGSSGNDPADGGGLVGDAGQSPNDYLTSLPAWPEPLADSNTATGEASTEYLTGTDSVQYKCTTTPYSLTDTPEKVVSFDPTVDVLWPGALVQGKSYQSGLLEALPINKRAPITVSIPGLLFEGNNRVVEQPSVATVGAAIGEIIGAAVDKGVAASSSISYQQTTAYSSQQAALSLGVSATYLGGSVDATLDLSASSDMHSVIGYFVQNMFTVTVPQPAAPGEFFSADLTGADMQNAVNQGWIGPDNLPVYVSSVTYGRIMMFSITSRATSQEIQAALNAQYNGGVASGAVSAKYSELMANGSTVFKVVTVGGDAANAVAMISSGDPSAFFDSAPALSTAKPISYELRNLGNNSSAKLSETTAYNVKTCVASTVGAGPNVLVSTFGPTKQVLGYDSTGAAMPLVHPLSETGATTFYNGIAWAAQADRFYVSRQQDNANPPCSIRAYEIDGTPVTLPAGAFPFTATEYPRKLSYDIKNDRIIAVVNANAVQTIRFYTPSGALIPGGSTPINTGSSNVSSAIYVASKDRLYATSFASAGGGGSSGKVFVFKLNGQDVTGDTFKLPGGGTLPWTSDLAYDSQHDQFLVGGRDGAGGGALYVFDKDGTYLRQGTFDDEVFSVAYDQVHQQILVLMTGLGGVAVVDPETLDPIATPNGSFSGIDIASQLAFRP